MQLVQGFENRRLDSESAHGTRPHDKPRPRTSGANRLTRRTGFGGSCPISFLAILAGLVGMSGVVGQAASEKPVEKGSLRFLSCEDGAFRFQGVLGRRIDANTTQWLLCAPRANPGMIEMFRQRDRQPVPDLVPWAGEFVGKYLLSAIAALRLTDDPRLRVQAREVVRELISTQAEDGYLGPFPKASRLKGNWDLWGHYHIMQALLLWHEMTGDADSLAACRRAADLMCATFLDGSMRVFDAASHEMNMAVIHGLGQLYRATGEPRYWRLMQEIEKDWQRAGDYFRSGLDGREFFESPRPRWESLHDLQGLVELYRITGDPAYRQSFEHHWRSIVRWDRHNTGAFSSGEQATGNPYAAGAIETCCTVAWMALSVDMLRLTGDPRVADELEMATFNATAAAQHPSGRWWTYSTPMDGVREASAHSIVFQARAGTPELNCCSVNGPRSLAMLSEWALMKDAEGLIVNFYGSGHAEARLSSGAKAKVRWETEYPLNGHVRVGVESEPPAAFALRLRIPAWAAGAKFRLNAEPAKEAPPGQYLSIHRTWASGDVVDLELGSALRCVPGDREVLGKVSVYQGPLLLAYDQHYNSFDENRIPILSQEFLRKARVVPGAGQNAGAASVSDPWVLVEVPAANAGPLRLCDFASAGSQGTRYRSWLAAQDCPPPAVVSRSPADGALVAPGAVMFRWTGPRKTGGVVSDYRLVIGDAPDCARPVLSFVGLASNRVILNKTSLEPLNAQKEYYWKVVARNSHGSTESVGPASRFRIDPSKPAEPAAALLPIEGPGGVLVKAALDGKADPTFGRLVQGTSFETVDGFAKAAKAVALDGRSQKLTYAVDGFPDEDYSLTVRVRLAELPKGHLGQVFSAWCRSMDDPLRLCVDGTKLHARIEAGQVHGTAGVPVEAGRWYSLAVIKSGPQLTLFVDGKAGPPAVVPAVIQSGARDFSLGGNPHFTGNEFLAATFADFSFFARALTSEEIAAFAGASRE